MHILLVHQAFASPGQPGGTRHYELARYLTQHGHNFTIVASNLSYLTGKQAVDHENATVHQTPSGMRILYSYTYPALHNSFFHRVISFISFMTTAVWTALRAGPVDVVMGTSPPIFQALSAWSIAFLRRRPFLLEIRDLWPEFAVDMGILTNPILITLSRWLVSFLYAQASHILVNSPAYRDYLINKGVPGSKITLIANGVDSNMFNPAAKGEAIRRQWQLSEQFVVTYAGAIGVANDIPTILKAAHHLRDHNHIHFMLVGDGKERANVETIARELNLANVTLTGALPKSQMADVLSASDACLATLQNIPMFTKTYPNKVFDYMAAGRPVVLAIDGVIRTVIEEGQAGIFVPPGDSKALAEAVLALAVDPVRCAQLGANGRRYVIQHFERAQQARQFEQLMVNLANYSLKKGDIGWR